jgi:hypothetical protein
MPALVSYAGERDTGNPKPPQLIDCRAWDPAINNEQWFVKRIEATIARPVVRT